MKKTTPKSKPATKNSIWSKEILTVLAIQITEVLGFSLVLPFLPFYAQELGASPLLIGLILTSYSIFQFFSAPIMGQISDSVGRKPMLLLSQLSTLISFVILAFSNNLWMIFLSRAIDGIFGSNMTIAQAYIADISTPENRGKAMSISGMAFGIGFLIGPAIGGFLSQFGYWIPSLLAAGVTLITIITTITFLRETVTKKENFKITWNEFNFFRQLTHFKNPTLRTLIIIYFSYVLTHGLWVSNFALYADRQLGATAREIGFFLTYIGVISTVLRGGLMSKLIDIFGEYKLQISGMAMTIMGLFMARFTTTWGIFLIITGLFSIGSGMSRPVITAGISRTASDKQQGEIMGLLSSLQSVSQMITPIMGGFIIQTMHPGNLGIAAAMIMSIGLILTLKVKK
jgi:DHA1 family tetracycline resistance protein-like MFS transporter